MCTWNKTSDISGKHDNNKSLHGHFTEENDKKRRTRETYVFTGMSTFPCVSVCLWVRKRK